MRVEFWEGRTKRWEGDLAVVPEVGDRVSLPSGAASVLARLFVLSSPSVRVSVGPPNAPSPATNV